MFSKIIKSYFKNLYIFFIFLSLYLFFFSTVKVEGKSFDITNIEISEPFEMNFNKNIVIDEGFKKAFSELLSLIVNSTDKKKIGTIQLKEIKSMIESFSIKEEKFIDNIYFLNLGVSFNKKEVFSYLEKNNIFPSIPVKKKILFIPVIIDENKKELLIFSNNKVFENWNNQIKKTHLINYILPTDDLEDLMIIKKNFETIEEYSFDEIIKKYDLKDSIISLIFKNENEIRILSKISIKENTILKNQSLKNINFGNDEQVQKIIDILKNSYEDYWKNLNKINTSIKLPINIKIQNLDNHLIMNFEKILKNIDLVYDFSIKKFDNKYIYYQIIFNGTPNIFLDTMLSKNYKFDTRNKVWILE